MQFRRLEIKDLRILADVVLEPSPRLNLIQGPNGAGKTALLEAIYVLARGRSFRTPRISEIIRRGQPALQVTARIDHENDGAVIAGVERGAGPLLIRYRGETVRRISEHASRLPLVLLTPDSQALVLGGPKERRHWLDWAMFHVEPAYLEHWRTYFQALRHRNALLKRYAKPAEFEGWEEIMSTRAESLDAMRKQFTSELQQEFAGFAAAAWSLVPEISLDPGWSGADSLAGVLRSSRGSDREAGFTRAGPHRADLDFAVNGGRLEAFYSRGEGKLFIALLLLSQAEVIARRCGEKPVFLADDFAAELDTAARHKVVELIRARPWQSFLTGTDLGFLGTDPETGVFHVEHGVVRKMVE